MGITSCTLFALTCLLILTHFEFLQTEAFCSKYVEPEGYSCHEHKLYTEDGYGILLHRVGATSRKGPLPGSIPAFIKKPFISFPETEGSGRTQLPMPPADASVGSSGAAAMNVHGPNQAIQGSSRRGDPVLLLHPEMLNGDSWFKHVDSENQTARLPFHLADNGFDVWIGHNRATLWSHDHTTVTHYEPVYWNWTWDQLAQYDVPTMLRFVRSETHGKVHVVGFSQGATVGAAAATRPDVADNMNSLTLIGPPIYRGIRNPFLRGPWAELLRDLFQQIKSVQVNATRGWVNLTREFELPTIVQLTDELTEPLPDSRFSISGPDCCLSPSLSLIDNGWDGTTSSSNIEHFQQASMTPNWRKFDHGTEKLNLAAYGRPTPPDYEPQDIPADLPVLVVHGRKDMYSPSEGLAEFIASLQSRPSIVSLPDYAHLDLFFSTRRKEDVYDPLRAFLRSNRST